jgi:phosphoglycolate phosphatase-like HAD superfamily hydrolase
MNFKNFYKNKPKVFLDMDGVLCNFKTPLMEALDKKSYSEVTEDDVDNFFTSENTSNFFANLPKYNMLII